MLRMSRRFAAAAEVQQKTNLFKAPKEDPFLRKTTRPQFYLSFHSLPFVGRILVSFVIGFVVGAGLEVFICKTHLYETVMHKKTERRHEIDEFTVDFRANMLKWQEEDMERAKLKQQLAVK
jgi:hypothetical protein